MILHLRRHHRAFLLVEMMFALALLVVFALIATRMVRLAMEIPRRVAARDTSAQRLDSAIRALRRDVWSASSIECPDDRTLKIGNGSAVTWKVGSDGAITRASSADKGGPARWMIDGAARFKADGPTFTLSIIHPISAQGRVEMISQRMLLQEAVK
jgi:competence protein ComGC